MNLMRRPLIFISLILLQLDLCASKLNLEVAAEGAILMNAKTGVVLYEKNPHKQQYPASITKLVTAWYALKTNRDRLDEVIVADNDAIASTTEEAIRRSNFTLPSWWIEVGSSHIGIKKGEEMTLRDLLYGMMLRSGNDAANVIAQYVGGTIPNYLDELNSELKAMGFKQTHFMNPHGLHHPKHVTTPYEIAQIARLGMQDPTFREIVKTVRYTRPKTNKNVPTPMVQTNHLLRQGKYFYSKAVGIKTGFHSKAQHTLVAAAEYEGRTLIAVLMKSQERPNVFIDAKRLFEAAFNQPKVEKLIIKPGPQKFVLNLEGASQSISSYAKEELKIEYYPAEEPTIKCLLCWQQDLKPPIQKDQRIGELKLVDDKGQQLAQANLYAEQEVKSNWSYWFKNLF